MDNNGYHYFDNNYVYNKVIYTDKGLIMTEQTSKWTWKNNPSDFNREDLEKSGKVRHVPIRVLRLMESIWWTMVKVVRGENQ